MRQGAPLVRSWPEVSIAKALVEEVTLGRIISALQPMAKLVVIFEGLLWTALYRAYSCFIISNRAHGLDSGGKKSEKNKVIERWEFL